MTRELRLVVGFKWKNPPRPLRERVGVRGSASARHMTLLPPAGGTPSPGSLRCHPLPRWGEGIKCRIPTTSGSPPGHQQVASANTPFPGFWAIEKPSISGSGGAHATAVQEQPEQFRACGGTSHTARTGAAHRQRTRAKGRAMHALYSSVLGLSLLMLLTACGMRGTSVPDAPLTSVAGLRPLTDTQVSRVWVHPGRDLSRYRRVLIRPIKLVFPDPQMRDVQGSALGSIDIHASH